MNTSEKWHGTTIVLLRKNNETVVAGDGQVSLGNTVLPRLTWPSPATTVSLFFLSKTIVVPCHFSLVFIQCKWLLILYLQ